MINFDTSIIKNTLDSIPKIIEFLRNLIIKLITSVGLQESYYMFIAGAIALFAAYYFLKQFITYSVFGKISTFLNWLVLSLLFYLILTYI